MGSEHSSQHGMQLQTASVKNSNYKTNFRRQHTIANPGAGESSKNNGDNNASRPGSISPGPSVCSDIDLPYISYTVNRPIGDSPKLANKQLIKSKSTPTKRQQVKQYNPKLKNNAHNIVVVRGAENINPGLDKDPDVMRLQKIPMFLPIMRATLSLPAARDPEVLECLDPTPFRNLCLRYQRHLTSAANLVATEQNYLTQKVREIDSDVTKIINTSMEKQKKFAKYAEKLGKTQEISHQLNKCHMLLNQILESMDTLNNQLDIDDRLEPFVWTTG